MFEIVRYEKGRGAGGRERRKEEKKEGKEKGKNGVRERQKHFCP